MVIPKKICGCPFLWFVSFGQAKEMNIDVLGEKKMNKENIRIAESEISSDFIAIKYHLS
jgi:hypothetical protein